MGERITLDTVSAIALKGESHHSPSHIKISTYNKICSAAMKHSTLYNTYNVCFLYIYCAVWDYHKTEVPAIKCDNVRISEGVAVGGGDILHFYLKMRDQFHSFLN